MRATNILIMTELGNKILKLREKGLSYKQIRSKLKCSISTVYYYCNTEGKLKTYNRTHKNL